MGFQGVSKVVLKERMRGFQGGFRFALGFWDSWGPTQLWFRVFVWFAGIRKSGP